MRIPRIYTAQSLQGQSLVELEPGPSQHIAKSLRMSPGDTLILFDGRGGEHQARIEAIERKSVRAVIADFDPVERESPLLIALGIALSRGDRMDWVVQKATELGVASIVPLQTERSEVRLKGDRLEKKLRHWQQVAISACEQCRRNRLPDIQPVTEIRQWVEVVEADTKLVLHHRAGAGTAAGAAPGNVALLIGPEGGLSPEEIAAAEQAGFTPMQLGPRVLRTETAPLAAIAMLQAQWGDMAPGTLSDC